MKLEKEIQKLYEKIGDNQYEIEKVKLHVRLNCDMCGRRYYDFFDDGLNLCKNCRTQFDKRKRFRRLK